MRAAILALSGAIALGGCASDKLTLLDNEGESATGAVAVLDPITGEDRALLDTQLTEAKLTSRPKPRTVKELKPAYTELLGNLPPKAKPFPIFFPKGGFEIAADQRATFVDIRKELLDRPGAQIEVVGFTDSTGTEELNNTISKQRAKSVADVLREEGFIVEAEDEVGRGKYEALKKNGDNVVDETFRTVIVLIR